MTEEKEYYRCSVSEEDIFEDFKIGFSSNNTIYYDCYLGLQHQIKKDVATIYRFLKSKPDYDNEKTRYYCEPIIQFSKLKRYIVTLVDSFANHKKEKLVYYIVQTVRGKYIFNQENLFLNLQKISKENKAGRINTIKLIEYMKESKFFEDLFVKNEKWTTEYGYNFDEHICPENGWTLVKKRKN